MNKKKAIKIVAASAIAASAFAAVAPTQSQAATSVATTVTNAQKAMKAPFDKYYQTGITKKTVSAATVQALITKGEKAYADATAVVKKSGGKSAKTYQAKLDGYKKYLDRSKAYVAGLGSLSKVYANADAALKANTVAGLEKAKAELKDSKNQGYVGISKIYGPVVREVLTGAFKRLSEARLVKVEAALEELATPAVTSVSAINATQVQVKFNKAVDEDDVTTNAATLFTIDGQGAASATLSADGKTATLTFASASQVEVTDAVVVVNPVKLAADTEKSTPKYTTVLTYEDTVKPEISEIVSTTKGGTAVGLTVTTSEPVVSSLAKVDGSYYTVTYSGNTGTINGLSLDASKPHTLELINLTDGSGNVTVSTSKSFNVTVDASAPTATLSAQSDKGILLTFSKPMNVTSVTSALATTAVKDELLGNVGYTAPVAAVAGSNDTKFLIPVTDSLYTNKTSRTLSVVLPGTIEDKLGNTIVSGAKTVTLSKDTAKPVATSYKLVKDSQGQVTDIVVNFSEGLAANATPAAPTVVDMNGVDVTSTLLGGFTADAVAAGDKKVTYSVGSAAVVSGKYAFSFGANLVSDQAETPNSSAAFDYTIDFGNADATFNLPSAPTSAGNVITVEFGRGVKGGAVANSATDLANYTLAGKPLPTGTTVRLDSAQDTATITLPAGTIEKTDAAALFTVSNVKALNGVTLNTSRTTLGVVDNVQPVLSSAVLNSDDTITIGFSEALAAAPAVTDFVVTENGTSTPLTALNSSVAVGTGLNAGKYVLTINNIASDTSGLFIDTDNNNTRDAGEVALTSLKLSTASSTTTTDASTNNTLKAATTITIK